MAALFVDRGGCYSDVPGVDVWDAARDARLYRGPLPVVAHPPCARWCRLAGLVESRWGHRRGEDGGCFEAALAAVREFGGVLEHPAYSDAWPAFRLPVPPTSGGWAGDLFGGWSAYIEQWRYGHRARKPTWLYANGVELVDLRWGYSPRGVGEAVVGYCQNHPGRGQAKPRLSPRERAATSPAFRDALLSIARSAHSSIAAAK